MGIRDRLVKALDAGRKAFEEGDGDEGRREQPAPLAEREPSSTSMLQALQQAGLPEPTEEKPRALFHDPYSITDWGGWRENPSALSYETLRRMSEQNSAIAAIINIRCHQVASFAKPQQGRYDRGYRIVLRDRRDQKRTMTSAEQRQAAEIERMLETTAVLLPSERPSDRDSFRDFLRKFVRDLLTYDQATFEKIRDKRGRVSRFIMLPSHTIRPAVADIEHIDVEEMRNRVSHVQVFEETVIAEFSPDDVAWCVMNPRSDLRVNSFGFSPIEQIMQLVTAWLFGFQYNQKFFCVSAGTLVTTDKGLVSVDELADKEFTIWNGRDFVRARGYETGRKPVVRTKLANGLSLRTSPKHLFRVVPRESEMGCAEWREQRALKQGDVVLLGYRRSDCALNQEALLVGKQYETDRETGRSFCPTLELVSDPQFWEMVGFALGDGYWPSGRVGHMSIFPHHTKDAPLFERFLAVCARHGIHAELKQVNKHHARVTDGVAGYPSIRIFHKAFVRWLSDLGFSASSANRCIPSALFAQPAWIREAVLRGLFSADGCTVTHQTGYRTPTVHSSCEPFRQDILSCLWSVGVAASEVGSGWDRHGTIRVQDVRAFVERVGFLQAYKNEGIERADQSADRWDSLHSATARAWCSVVMNHEGWLSLSTGERNHVAQAFRGDSGISRPRLLRILRQLSIDANEEELALCHVEVDVLDVKAAASEEMYDVEVFDDEHVFLANHMAVHNTQGANIKGILNIKGAIPDKQLKAFRRLWYSMVSGVSNAWKTPILNSEDLQWVSMHSTNAEMEYGAWMDWLTKLICAVFAIDPLEINFQFGNTGQKAALSSARPNEDELVESKDKGLTPLMEFVEDQINSHLIWELNPDFEFSFTGLNAKEEQKEREGLIAEGKAYKMVDEVRAFQDLDPLPDGKGQVILDSVWLQASQGAQGGEGGGEDQGGQNPLEHIPGEGEDDQGPGGDGGEGPDGAEEPPEGGEGAEPQPGKGKVPAPEEEAEEAEKSLDRTIARLAGRLGGDPLRKSGRRRTFDVDLD